MKLNYTKNTLVTEQKKLIPGKFGIQNGLFSGI